MESSSHKKDSRHPLMVKQASKNILNYRFLNRRSFQAYVLVILFFQKKLAFNELIRPILRGGFKTKSERSKFRHLFFEYINEHFGPFILYEHPFFPASENYIEAIAWIEEVIIRDQYRTNLIKDGNIVIDAGGNIGTFSIKVAHDFPHSAVYTFEPTPRTFATLKENTAPYTNISCNNMGLSSEVGEMNLSIWDDFSGSNSFSRMADPAYGDPDHVQTIKMTTIDEFAKDLPSVDFIKMDVEGHEANILKGAAKTIQKWKPIIAMSAYHNPEDKEELPRLLQSICSDYVCELRHDFEEDLICRVPQPHL
jgi:FkbM family methyltransferase